MVFAKNRASAYQMSMYVSTKWTARLLETILRTRVMTMVKSCDNEGILRTFVRSPSLNADVDDIMIQASSTCNSISK